MTAIDWAALSRLLPEALLVALFMYFTRDQQKAHREQILELLNHSEAGRAEARSDFLKTNKDARDDFLKEMQVERQERHSDDITLNSKMDSLAALVASTNALITQHDTWERNELDRRLPLGNVKG